MNKQRKVVITTTYNEMGIIIDTKVEEVAQPNLQPSCNHLATDTISRQAAIDALRTCYDTETITMDNGDEYINYGDAVGEIEQLPPIQPKKGKWLPADSLYHGAPFYYCSECGEKMLDTVMGKPRWNFCPMCGSRNEVTE